MAVSLGAAIAKAKLEEFSNADEAASHLEPFVKWCTDRGVKSCPASPEVVAAFVTQLSYLGEEILQTLRAIEIWHDHFNYSNPVSTAKVRAAVAGIVQVDPPRSWTKAERDLFRTVSPSVQAIVARREADREKALRQAQNRVADEIKRLKAAADTKPAELKEENNGNGNVKAQ